MSAYRHKHIGLIGGIMLLAVLFIAPPSHAQCVNGIPCVVGKTFNDPLDPLDGPNAAGAPNAGKTDSKACDADFMNQIYARAFLEFQRQNIINEVIVRKPDSVLEYTCFDQMASMVAHIVGPLFSESTHWQNRTITIGGPPGGGEIDDDPYPNVDVEVYMGSTMLDDHIEILVLESLKQYVDDNFWHEFLGHTSGLNNNISNTVGGANYSCQFMNNVFFLAKCRNFAEDDLFNSFTWLASNDPRALPTACGTGTLITTNLIDVSENKNFTYVNFDEVNPTYLSMINPPACGTPIPTGVFTVKTDKDVDRPIGNVTITLTNLYENKVCSNPSCYYNYTTDTCDP